MNILHLQDEPWDSGIAHYALTLAAEQARRGHRVEFWGREGSPVVDAARALGLKASGWNRLGVLSQLRRAAEFNPRVINAHTGSSQCLAIVLAAGRSCAVVRTRGDARLARATPLTRFAAARTSLFIAANSALEASLIQAHPRARVTKITQGVTGPDIAPPLPGQPIVGMLARFDPVKGHDVLIAAMSKLKETTPNMRAACAGSGTLLDAMRAKANAAGLGSRIAFPGRVEDPGAFIASCRIGTVPSLSSEAVSRATLEWMSAGRAVVASRVGGIPDLVEDGVSGLLVDPGDSDGLARAFSSLLYDPGLAESMGRAARLRWQEQFSMTRFYESTQRAYDAASSNLPS
ncbi:MAG: glycosyltransferase family 4 protein [Elusimicrobiota bacterium]